MKNWKNKKNCVTIRILEHFDHFVTTLPHGGVPGRKRSLIGVTASRDLILDLWLGHCDAGRYLYDNICENNIINAFYNYFFYKS